MNILDTLHAMHPEKITLEDVAAFAKSQHFSYDKDAALYYLAVLLESGDLESVARRLKDAAVLTVGLASPETVTQVITLANTAREIGLPRATSALTMATMLFCICPRSDSARWTYARAKMDEQNPIAHPIPAYLRDDHYKGAGKLRGAGIKLDAFSQPHQLAKQAYLPQDWATTTFSRGAPPMKKGSTGSTRPCLNTSMKRSSRPKTR